jgi:pimeloyl-ACP methyl ester carboxylesterase
MKQPRLRPPIGRTLLDFVSVGPRQRITHESIRGCPRGDGGPVLVLPGILRDDRQTASFRDGLHMLDYTPFGWELGPNYGPTRDLMDGAKTRLARLARDHGPVRLVGFSMGGLFARWLAHARPHMVRQVITVCSPFRDPLNSAWFPVGPLLPLFRHVDMEALAFMVQQTPPVPWGAVYSAIDGVVTTDSCWDPDAPERCVEVRVRHRLAQREAGVLNAVGRFLGEK